MRLLLALLLVTPLVLAAGPLANTTCYNSVSCERNLQDIIQNATNGYATYARWNNTYVWTGGDCVDTDGAGCLQVPKYASSSECVMNSSSLSSYGSGACSSGSTRNQSVNVQVTDELSEVGMVVCAGNASAERVAVAYMNTIDSVGAACSTYGDLPGWTDCLNFTDIQCLDGNAASDANHRIAMGLYLCADNEAFSQGNRTRAFQLASKIMNQSIQYDTTGPSVTKTTVSFGTLAYWLFGGPAQAAFSGTPEEDQYGGYYGDAIKACVIHSTQNPSNASIRAVCGNWTAQFLAMTEYDGGTGPTDFESPYVRIWFNESGGVVRPGPPSGFSGNYDGTQRCDDADCPRFMNVADALTLANASGLYDLTTAPWKNLSDYVQAFSKTGWVASTSDAQACQSYDDGGACGAGPYDSIRLVGMLAPSLTWMNRSQFVNITSELNRHWSWTTRSVSDGGVTCGSGITYDAVRWPKALIVAVGLEERLVGGNILADLQGGGGGGWSCDESTLTSITSFSCTLNATCYYAGTNCSKTLTTGANALSYCTASGCA